MQKNIEYSQCIIMQNRLNDHTIKTGDVKYFIKKFVKYLEYINIFHNFAPEKQKTQESAIIIRY